MGFNLVLKWFAVACFGLATFNVASGRLVPAGLLCLALSEVI